MRLIDADALKKEFCKDIMGGLNWERIIDNAPTVEITEEQAIDKLRETGWLQEHDKQMTERPHGEWNEILEPFGWDDIKSAQCSACGESYPTDCGFDDIVEMFKYCPECGAKMEAGTRWKEEEEEDQP